MADVTLKHVSKIYSGGVRAVSDVNVEIADGQFIILVGPSGCGKSTLLRMIAGLETISEGELYIDKKLVNDVAAKDRDIAMVFQNYALYPHMTVFENMAFGLKMRNFPKDEIARRVREAGDVLDLTRYLERKPKALSGGQRQRVAVGRAIVRQPSLFLFDEPLSNLDAKLRVAMRAELIRLHKRLRATMIYVTHDQMEAMSMGDMLIVLKDGVVQQKGPPLEIYNWPANTFVAGFIGSPAMNFLTGEITGRNGGQVFDTGSLQLDASVLGGGLAGRRVTIGVRPEWMRVDKARSETDVLFPARVEVIERMGSDTFVNISAGAHELVARIDPQIAISMEETRNFSFDMREARLYDGETGILLKGNGEQGATN